MECDKQVIVALTVDAGQINGTETVVATRQSAQRQSDCERTTTRVHKYELS